MDYYRQTCFLLKIFHTSKIRKLGKEVMYSSKYFNSKYIEFVCYEICDKLIWTSGERIRIINKISKQGITKKINKVSTTSALGRRFGFRQNLSILFIIFSS